MNIFNEYFKLLQEVYNYFGFEENWAVFPLDDRRAYYWKIVNDEEVQYGEKSDIINDTEEYYSDEIYKQRFYEKWIYRGEEYTMIMVDTHTDGNKFLAIFNNSKEMKGERV